MSVLDGFFSTWSMARDKFGQGTPATGEQYDKSGPLTTMQTTVQSAAPGSKWIGTAASAYDAANTDHGKVFGKLAGLDQRLSAQITQSAQVVDTGRSNLDKVRDWVVAAAASVPEGKNRDQLLMPIVQKGLRQVSDIINDSHTNLGRIGSTISGIGAEYDALGDQKFGKDGEQDGDGTGDQPGDGIPPEVDPAQAEHDVHQVLAGTATEEELARVRAGLTLSPDQQLANESDQHVDLTAPQQQYLGQMQAQMHGMSIDDIATAQQRLGDDKWLVSDSLQMMSSDQFTYAKVPLEVGAPGSLTETVTGGGANNQLPTSFHNALSNPAQVSRMEINGGFPMTYTDYPTQDDLHELAGIVKEGHPAMQQGSYLDRQMLERGSEMLAGEEIQSQNPGMVDSNKQHVDPTVQDIFSSAGRDSIASHDLLTSGATDPISGQPHGQTVIENLSKHDWQDDGQAARNMTDWIDDAAKSDNPILQERAGTTAQAIANVLGNPDNHLLHLQNHPGSLGGGETTIGQRNPALVQGFAEALTPYQDAMVGDNTIPGFHALDDASRGDMSHTRSLFAAIDSDDTAAKQFNGAAFENVAEFQKDFAELAGQGTDMNSHGDDPRGLGMQRAGLLAGVIDAGAVTEARESGANEFEAAKSSWQLKHDALDFAVGLGTDKLPVVGGFANAMGKDALLEMMIGKEPTQETYQPGQQHAVQDYRNFAAYTIANELVAHDTNGTRPPDSCIEHTPDGGWRLKDPASLDANERDEYYGNLYNYLQSPLNNNIIQSVDQFNDQYENGSRT